MAGDESPLRTRRTQHSFELEVGTTANGVRDRGSTRVAAFEAAKPATIQAVNSDREPLFTPGQASPFACD